MLLQLLIIILDFKTKVNVRSCLNVRQSQMIVLVKFSVVFHRSLFDTTLLKSLVDLLFKIRSNG